MSDSRAWAAEQEHIEWYNSQVALYKNATPDDIINLVTEFRTDVDKLLRDTDMSVKHYRLVEHMDATLNKFIRRIQKIKK